MKKLKLIIVALLAVLLVAAASGAAVWWKLGGQKAAAKASTETEAAPPKAEAEAKPGPEYKYVMLDKVLVMLRGRSGDAVTHYMALDVVLKALPEQEKRAKEHLPLLRTIAVKALSSYTLEAAQALTIGEVAEVLNKAYRESYAAEQHETPFAEALIGKLIIE